jgi:hypothetical protein
VGEEPAQHADRQSRDQGACGLAQIRRGRGQAAGNHEGDAAHGSGGQQRPPWHAQPAGVEGHGGRCRRDAFFTWIVVLLTIAAALVPFALTDHLADATATGLINAVIGFAVLSLLRGVAAPHTAPDHDAGDPGRPNVTPPERPSTVQLPNRQHGEATDMKRASSLQSGSTQRDEGPEYVHDLANATR